MSSVLIFGKPNSGKTLLFNRMTGMRQKVANFPGVTVEIKTGRGTDSRVFVDHPGVYSFQPMTEDEAIAVQKFDEALADESTGIVVGVLDATRMERSLALGLEAKHRAEKAGKPFFFALNMMDEIIVSGSKIDIEGLSNTLGCPVVPISARTGMGLDDFKKTINEIASEPGSAAKSGVFIPEEPLQGSWSEQARHLQQKYGTQSSVLLKTQNRLDRVFLAHVWGGLLFFLIMLIVFQSIFTWAVPLMDLTEDVVSFLGVWVVSLLPAGAVSDFVKDAIFGGLGSFIVFVPQIFILTFIVGILEDSGYLARAAIICHKPLSLFGLSGRSFIPLLSGHACAIPAVFAARTMESPIKRLLTIIAIPMMACSARLPVYTLLIVALIPPVSFAGGLIGLQGLAFFALYLFGILVGLLVSGFIARVRFRRKNTEPFILELPPYRLPHWKPLILKSASASSNFVRRAGPVIFAVTVLVWLLGYFPAGADQLDQSFLAQMGKAVEPVFELIGLDWIMAVAVISSIVAREVFVGTLGTLFGMQGAEENIAGLAENLQASGLSLASGVALLVFYAVALQCVSTLAVIRKESGSLKLPTLMFTGYTLLAFALSYATYHFVGFLT